MPEPTTRIAGLILAGGLSSRMGSPHKSLARLGSQTILDSIIANARPQTDSLTLSVNRDPGLFTPFGLSLLPDVPGLTPGPLLGIYSALKQFESLNSPDARPLLACFPGDTPWFPDDLFIRLQAAMWADKAEVGWLRTEGQLQPLFSLWSPQLTAPLLQALQAGEYSPRYFIESRRHTLLNLENLPPHHFFNINDQASLAKARGFATSVEK